MPRSRSRSRRPRSRAAAMTRPPSSRASWTAKLPMPPDAPVTRTTWPATRPPSTTRLVQPVSPASGTAAPSTNERFSGSGSSWPAGTAARVAWPPPASSAITLAPTFQRSTPSPTATMVPAHSSPGTSLSPGGGGYWPASCSWSARLRPAASTATSTSPSRGTGSGSSPTTGAGRTPAAAAGSAGRTALMLARTRRLGSSSGDPTTGARPRD